MKQNWEYKKLGEVGSVIGGSTPRTNVAEFWNGDNYWVTPAELKGDKFINSTERKISNKAVQSTNLTLLPAGTVLLSSRAPIGKVCITNVPMYCNQGFKNIICGPDLYNEYLYWWLKSKTEYLNSLGVGATFKEISKRVVEKIKIPVPPLSEQQRIVAELDLLTGIIDKQNAQLKELDTLAQSIFYDMFGDPIQNEKGWNVKKISDVSQDVFAGGDKPEDFKDAPTDEYCYPIIANGIGDRGVLGYSRKYRVGSDAVTIGARGASIGNCRICKAFFTPVVRLITIIPSAAVDITFLYFVVQLLNFNINGAGQAQLTVPNVKSQVIPVPPLALQQEFADKIQSIEKQKAAVNQSIAETQTLLDYTMDKYFG